MASISCTINNKINGTPEYVYLPISKLHSILALANLLAIITYGYVIGQVNLLRLKSCNFEIGKYLSTLV